ncbi:DUF4347 domain-containing protein [Lyngbya sp. CCY1209]|uniref:DUF4347 domain-containing protein n=1 Tax=Lyngbya sp. CCY1209 TaxID=2886103 RepID=UPI002D211360|nr:DUF4347 domain-containing protein [Lyngbya sp. CCY1209]MEB3887133.1 DUF4347 domain-containing protein [Lyngbya sp. CCY1209]
MNNAALSAKKETSKKAIKLLFLDTSIPDLEVLKSGAIAAFETVAIDRKSDGIYQISTHLKKYRQPVELHLVSHGSPGCLHLGCNSLNLENISHYSDQIKAWNLSALILYGCNVATGDAGSEFIEKLYHLTGANIAASTTKTGHSDLGGNWEFDVLQGDFEVDLAWVRSNSRAVALCSRYF